MSPRTQQTAAAGARRQEFGELQPGDHIVFIYENADELRAFLVPFIKAGLAKGECCVYIVDDLDPTKVTEALIAGGVDVTRETARGALVFLSAREYYALPSFNGFRVTERTRREPCAGGAHAVGRPPQDASSSGSQPMSLQLSVFPDEMSNIYRSP